MPEPKRRRRPINFVAACEYLPASPRHLRGLVARRAIPHTKVGRELRFWPADLDVYLEANYVEAAS